MSRWHTQFAVSDTDALAHRLEANAEPALDLNSDMLDWLCNATGSNLGDVLSRFPSGLVFDVEGVEAMVQELFPGARWAVGTICENRILHGARILLRGHQTPFAGMADTSACALLAALLRAYAATAAPDVARRAA